MFDFWIILYFKKIDTILLIWAVYKLQRINSFYLKGAPSFLKVFRVTCFLLLFLLFFLCVCVCVCLFWGAGEGGGLEAFLIVIVVVAAAVAVVVSV